MPASYLNLSSPIKRETNTYVDQDGVKFSSMLITTTAASAPSLVPAIGSVYELDGNLWVTQSDLTYSSDGLGKITVTASGPDLSAKPRVRIIPGAPKIYGLKPSTVVPGSFPPFHPNAGVSVEVTLIALETQLQTILSTYSRKLMPAVINGLVLPEPVSGPISLTLPPVPVEGIAGGVSPAVGDYYGFIGANIRTEPRGRAIVVVISFQEAGFMSVRQTGGNYTSLFSYNT